MRYMWKKRVKCLVCILLALLLTGCWDAHDIEDRDIALAVLVDRTQDGGYIFYVEIASIHSTSESGGGGDSSAVKKPRVIRSEGRTLVEAREALDAELNHPIFLGAVQGVMFTDRFAYAGIEEYMYRLRQINDYRKTLDVVVAQGEPAEILNVKPENDTSIGYDLEDTLQGVVDSGGAVHFSLADVLQKLGSPERCFLLPTVAVKNDQLALVGYSVFDGGYCKGFIPMDQCRGIAYILAPAPRFQYVVSCKEGDLSIEARMTERHIDAEYKHSQISYSLKYKFEITLLYPQKDFHITKDVQHEAEKKVQQTIEQDVYSAIMQSQNEYACDYLGLNRVFGIGYPEPYARMDWSLEYPKAGFSVHADVTFDVTSQMDYDPHVE